MTTFRDGPAEGQTLMLKRAARFLRVVCADGKWDALDQPGDSPQESESVWAYEITGKPSMCHIRASGGRGGFYPIASYMMVADQPLGQVLRDNEAWGRWCERHAGLNAENAEGAK